MRGGRQIRMDERKIRIRKWGELALLAGAAAAGIGLFGVAELRVAGGWGFPLDDSWIHLQFARNLGSGQGFSFNPGETSAGSSAPLWTLFLSILFHFPWNPLLSVKFLGTVLLLVNGWLTRQLARRVGLGPGWALLAGLTVVLTPRLLWASLSGMEVMAYVALATAGISLHLRSWSQKPSLLGTGFLGLAALARPECLILFPLAVLDRWRGTGGIRGLGQLYGAHLLLYAVLMAPFVGFNLQTIGKPLPNTFYAKVGGYGLLGSLLDLDPGRIARSALLYPVQQAQELVQFSGENCLLLAFLVPLGIVEILRSRKSETGSGSWVLPLIIVGFPLFRGLLAPFKGATFQHGRYAAYLVPLLTVTGLMGIRVVWRLLREGEVFPESSRLWKWGRPVVWLSILLNLAVVDLKYARTYGRNVRDIQEMHVATGKWLAGHTPTDAVIAANDIGAIGYFSRRRILDIVGLVTPDVLGYLEPGIPADKGVLRYLEKERPDYLAILPNWYPELAQRQDLFELVYEVALKDNSIAGGDRLVVYRTVWAE